MTESSRRRRRRTAPQASPLTPRPESAPAPRRLVVAVVVLATVAATLERWWFSGAWGESGSLTSAFYFGDATRFVEYAQAIAQGRSFDNGIPFHPPGWPLVMAGLMTLTGPDAAVPVAAIKLLLAGVSGLTVGMAVLLTYEIAGGGAMLAAACLGVFNFGHLVQGSVANSEALYGLLTVTTAWLVWRWLQSDARHPLWWAAAAGVTGGYAMLVRAEFLACAVILFALAWRAGGVWRRQAARPALALFVVAYGLVLVPTGVWHWQTLSAFNAAHVRDVAGPLPRLAPVTSYGPFNFAMANHEYADGGPNRDHDALDLCDQNTSATLDAGGLDLACPAIYDLYVRGYSIGLSWLLANPGAALSLLTDKAGMAIGFLAHGYFIDNIGAGVDGVRRRVDLVDPASRWLLPIHLALLVAGVVMLRRQPPALGVLSAGLGALIASTLLFYGYVRLGVAYLPIVWVLQGTALAALSNRVIGIPWCDRRVIGSVLAALALLTLLDGARARTPRSVALDGARTTTGMLIEDETLNVVRTPSRR
mgnify:CR=1 FL=1